MSDAKEVKVQGESVLPKMEKLKQLMTGKHAVLSITQPEYQSLFDDNEIKEIIDKINKIIVKYTANDDLSSGEKDMVILSALLINLSIQVGKQQAISTMHEHNRKLTHSENFCRISSLAEGNNVKLSVGETDELSRFFNKDSTEIAVASEMYSRILTLFFYSVKEFRDILNSSLNRLSRERL